MTPTRLLLAGGLVLAGALLLALLAAGLAGPANPSCEGFACRPLASLALYYAALATAIVGALVLAVGIARREPTADARFAWGAQGLAEHMAWADVIVLVDVLSFSTAVDIAVSRGATVEPALMDRADAPEGSILAQPRATAGAGPSLCPASLEKLAHGTRLILPSANGAALSLLAAERAPFAGCLRNARAVGRAAAEAGLRVLVVAAGERDADGRWREAEEDLWGAGAILGAMPARLDAGAQAAVEAFMRARPRLAEALAETPSGRELSGWGHPEDAQIAAMLDASRSAPRMRGGAYAAENVQESPSPTRRR